MSGRERRKYRRIPSKDIAGHVRVKDQVLAMGLPIDNISMGGLFIRCSNPLPQGTPVVLELVRPYSEPLKLVGTVAVSVDAVVGLSSGAVPGMGVQFETLATDTAKKLSALLMTLLASPPAAPPVSTSPQVPASEPARPAKRSALPAPAANPANIDDRVAAARSAFDFSFTSLDGLHHDSSHPAFNVPPASLTPTSPSARSATLPTAKGRAPAVEAPAPASARSGGRSSDAAPAPDTSASRTAPEARGAAADTGARAEAPTSDSSPRGPGEYLVNPRRDASAPAVDTGPDAPRPALAPIAVGDDQKLRVQVRGLLEDLGETQAELDRRARENDELRDRLHAAFEDLMRKDERIRQLEQRLAALTRA